METIAFNDFMNGSYKKDKSHAPKVESQKSNVGKTIRRVGTSIAIPLVLAKPVFAASPEAVTVSASSVVGHTAMSTLAHALDPLIDILVALSFPVASVIIVGSCFYFMIGNSQKGWSSIMNAGLGYVLIQVSPLILNMLKEIGSAF